ncbi:MAG TPA: hypothetical protein VLU38_08320 [Methanomassiliicoccales archaeon]|nr:hypothetical protein [Methanomassiliicoccales archaeon]
MTITSTSSTEIVLLIGSIVAIVVGLMGRKNKDGSEFKTAIRAISALVGAVMIIWAILMVVDGTWDLLMLLMVLLLGVGLLLPMLPKFNLGTILALIIAIIAAGAVSSFGGWAILITFLIVFFVLWFVFRLIFGVTRAAGAVLGSRWVLLVVGILGIAVAIYSMTT